MSLKTLKNMKYSVWRRIFFKICHGNHSHSLFAAATWTCIDHKISLRTVVFIYLLTRSSSRVALEKALNAPFSVHTLGTDLMI